MFNYYLHFTIINYLLTHKKIFLKNSQPKLMDIIQSIIRLMFAIFQ
jgi:hypothetical protein